MKTCVSIAILFILLSCNNRSGKLQWNLLGGTYEKVGEMVVWDGYWVEAYIDTTTNYQRLLFVNKDNYKTISDSLNVGILKNEESIDYGTVELNGKEDREIVAVFIKDDSLYHNKIVRAWKANVKTGKFEEFPTYGIRVKNIDKHYR